MRRRVLLRRRDGIRQHYRVKRVFKKGKYHTTLQGPQVIKLAQQIKEKLNPYAERIEIAGSIRRGQKNPVDIDFVMIPEENINPEKIKLILEKSGKITKSGSKMIEAKINGVDTDVYFTEPKSYGATLMTYTGPFGANIRHRADAKARGWKLSQYGLFDKNGKRIASTEKEIYNKLGLTYRKPELRGTPR